MSRRTATLTALFALPAGVIGFFIAVVLLITGAPQASAGGCGTSGPAVVIDVGDLPTGQIAGYGGVQLANAAAIMNAAEELGLDLHAQRLGVMAAMAESTLRVLDHGDLAGPDSRGLFQQRDNGAWGSYTDRMNPTISATNFYRALVRVPGWHDMAPTLAVHEMQGNQDPFVYQKFWAPAVQVVDALAGVQVHVQPVANPAATSTTQTSTTPSTASVGGPCGAPVSNVPVAAGGWMKPAVGPVTSGFSGSRVNPVTGLARAHTGTDIGAPCDAPIYAIHDATVVQAGPVSGYGNLITLDHGAGLTSRYAHMYPTGVLAHVGDRVPAGRQIGRVGSAGNSTGCHLHFEVQIGGAFTDPAAFLTARGATLG